MNLNNQDFNFFLRRGSIVLIINLIIFTLFLISKNSGGMITFTFLMFIILLGDGIYVYFKKKKILLFLLFITYYFILFISFYWIINNLLFSAKVPSEVIIE